jgi:hypothetical protein
MTPVLHDNQHMNCMRSNGRLGYRRNALCNVLISKQQSTDPRTYRQTPYEKPRRHQRTLIYFHILRIVVTVSCIVKMVATLSNEWFRGSVGHAMKLYVFCLRQREFFLSIEGKTAGCGG